MDNIQKMFQTIINGQSAFRQEIIKKLEQIEIKFDKKTDKLDQKMDLVRKELHERMDKLGNQLSYLEDDAPTREEFDKLENRVVKLEHPKTSTFS